MEAHVSTNKLRTVFLGTPAFAVPCLQTLAELSDVQAVVCQPDRPKGRGQEIEAPKVKQKALELGLPVSQPTKLRTGEFAEWLRALEVDLAVVVAYGRILSEDILAIPRLGCVNVHASILPRYRGAAPITWAIVRGETLTGVTLMQMDAGMDTGDMLSVHTLEIEPNETAAELTLRLSSLGAEGLRKDLLAIAAGQLKRQPQTHADATTAPMLKKEDGRIDFQSPAQKVHDHVRGMNPWPGAFTTLMQADGARKVLKVHASRVIPNAAPGATTTTTTTTTTAPAPAPTPGALVFADASRVLVCCGSGLLELCTVQVEGKRKVSGGEFWVGRGFKEGDVLGQ
jgi:methionyl-tRNA formyltransferase